jgi:hypothetical protein
MFVFECVGKDTYACDNMAAESFANVFEFADDEKEAFGAK